MWKIWPVLVLVASLMGCSPAGSGTDNASRTPREPKPTVEPQAPVRPTSDVYIEGLQLPAALAFTADDRLFFVEVNAGRVRVAQGRQLRPEPVLTVPVAQNAESGLLGLALAPDFASSHHVYIYYTVPAPADASLGLMNRLARFTERDGVATETTPILDNLPVNVIGPPDFHQGGALAFGPDRKLYVSIGDVGKPELAQDLSSVAGKILRVNPDGSVPSDNPFPGSPVFAYGFRNVWGMAFHPRTGALYASENGNKSHDEVNIVRPGGNYGWPLGEGTTKNPQLIDPLWDSGSSGTSARNGMVGLTVYEGSLFPELQGDLLFCAFKTGRIRRSTLRPPDFDEIRATSRLDGDCRLDITVGPDGAIFVTNITQIIRLGR